MAHLSSIITYLNDFLKVGSLADGRFSGSSYSGIATYIPDGDLVKVITTDQDGQAIINDLMYDQIYPMMVYHRLNSSKMRLSEKDGFGNQIGMRRVLDMSMMVFIDKSRIHLSGEDMEIVIYSGFPSSIKKADLTPGFTDCIFTFNGCEHNQVFLFDREFKMKNFNLSPSVVLLEVKYTIECGYQKNCINILCCPD